MKAYAIVSEQGTVQRIEYAEQPPEVEDIFIVLELDGMPQYPSKMPWNRVVVKDRQIVLEDTRSLNGFKDAKRAEINDIRNNLELQPVEWSGSEFDSDRDSIIRIIAAINMLKDTETIEWTLADNTIRVMTKADLESLMSAIGVRSSALHARARSLKSAVDSAQSAEELNQITW